MSMTRHFFVCDDLDEIENVESELERSGLVRQQIHVLSRDDEAIDAHQRLNGLSSFSRKDVVASTFYGALLGAVAAMLILGVAHFTGLAAAGGWTPFVFFAVVMLGFLTWEGGLLGIAVPNRRLAHLHEVLEAGRHVLFVDVAPQQEATLRQTLVRHPRLEVAGTGSGAPHWLVAGQSRARHFFTDVFP